MHALAWFVITTSISALAQPPFRTTPSQNAHYSGLDGGAPQLVLSGDLPHRLIGIAEAWRTQERQLEAIALFYHAQNFQRFRTGAIGYSQDAYDREAERITSELKAMKSYAKGEIANKGFVSGATSMAVELATKLGGVGIVASAVGKAGAKELADTAIKRRGDQLQRQTLTRGIDLGPTFIDDAVHRTLNIERMFPEFRREATSKFGIEPTYPQLSETVDKLVTRHPEFRALLESMKASEEVKEVQRLVSQQNVDVNKLNDAVDKLQKRIESEAYKLMSKLTTLQGNLEQLLVSPRPDEIREFSDAQQIELLGHAANATFSLAARLTSDPNTARRLFAAGRLAETIGSIAPQLAQALKPLKETGKLASGAAMAAATYGISLFIAVVDFAITMSTQSVPDIQVIADMVHGLHEHLDRLERGLLGRLDDLEKQIIATHFSVLEGFRRVENVLRYQSGQLETLHDQLDQVKQIALQSDLSWRRYSFRLNSYLTAQVAADCREPSRINDFFRCLEQLGNGALLVTPNPVIPPEDLASHIQFPFFFSGGPLATILSMKDETRSALSFLQRPLKASDSVAKDLPAVFDSISDVPLTLAEGAGEDGVLRNPDSWLRASAAFTEYAFAHREWIPQDPARFRRLSETMLNQGLDFETGYLRLGAESSQAEGKRNSVPLALLSRYEAGLDAYSKAIDAAKTSFDATALAGLPLSLLIKPSHGAKNAFVVADLPGAEAKKSIPSVPISALDPGRFDESTRRLIVGPCDSAKLHRQLVDSALTGQLDEKLTADAVALMTFDIPQNTIDLAEGLPAFQREYLAFAPYLEPSDAKLLPRRLVACIESIEWQRTRALSRLHNFRSTTNELCGRVEEGKVPDDLKKDAEALCAKLKAIRTNPVLEMRDDYHLVSTEEVLLLRKVGAATKSAPEFPELRHIFAFGYPSMTLRLSLHSTTPEGAPTFQPAVVLGRVQFTGNREVQFGSAFVLRRSEAEAVGTKKISKSAWFVPKTLTENGTLPLLWPNGNRRVEYFRSGSPKDGVLLLTTDELRRAVTKPEMESDDYAVTAISHGDKYKPELWFVVDRYAGDKKYVLYRAPEPEALGLHLLGELRAQLKSTSATIEETRTLRKTRGESVDLNAQSEAVFGRPAKEVILWSTNTPTQGDSPYRVSAAERFASFQAVPLNEKEQRAVATFEKSASAALTTAAANLTKIRGKVVRGNLGEGFVHRNVAKDITEARGELANAATALRAVSYLAYPQSSLRSPVMVRSFLPNKESLWANRGENESDATESSLIDGTAIAAQRKLTAELRLVLTEKARSRSEHFYGRATTADAAERHVPFQQSLANLQLLRQLFVNTGFPDNHIQKTADEIVERLQARYR